MFLKLDFALAPYTECSKEEYEALLTNMPEVLNWDLLSQYEQDDWTTEELQGVIDYMVPGKVSVKLVPPRPAKDEEKESVK